ASVTLAGAVSALYGVGSMAAAQMVKRLVGRWSPRNHHVTFAQDRGTVIHKPHVTIGGAMPTCDVCGGALPARRGPRPRRYCSRACQGKAYRARQASAARIASAAEDVQWAAEYVGTSGLTLAAQLANAASRAAAALDAGRAADRTDLQTLARLSAVLTARARQAAARAVARPAAMATAEQSSREVSAEDASSPVRSARSSREDCGSPGNVPTAAGQPSRQPPARRRSPGSFKRLTASQAKEVLSTAQIIKHPEHRDNHTWNVVDQDGTVLYCVEPTYGGASRSGRNGWRSVVHGLRGDRRPSRSAAVTDGAGRWLRIVTAKPRRTITGD
ncbi:hypothetical protein AB0435_12470, partial [Streptomyces sp. NPDC051173]